MTSKTFEIRDRGTTISALAVRLDPGCEADRRLFSWAGFGKAADTQGTYIVLVKLSDMGLRGMATYDPYWWADKTMREAHLAIEEGFDSFEDGAVIDCEYLRGERATPKVSDFAPAAGTP